MSPGGPPWPGEARVTFEWLDGEAFLIQRWTVDLPEAPNGIAIIGAGEEPGSLRQHYFDARGVHRVYEMTLADRIWRMWRDASGPPVLSDSQPRSAPTPARSLVAGRSRPTVNRGGRIST